jgi:hypothetical protein
VRLEGLGLLRKSNYLNRNQTRDLPAYNIVPQPATLPRDPKIKSSLCLINQSLGYEGVRGVSVFYSIWFYSPLLGLGHFLRFDRTP